MLGFTLLINIFFLVSSSYKIAVKSPQEPTPCTPGYSDPWQLNLPEKSYQSNTLVSLKNALNVLQDKYFQLWPGVWPTAIDWTAAVIGTDIAGALTTFSSNISELSTPHTTANLIDRYFAQLTASHFGQNVFALELEAFDDMLWVVLEWLEAIVFIDERSLKYTPGSKDGDGWYAQEWIPEFSHRARLFWDLASHGWNKTLCSGGMLWNPHLLPYKNAITNELYISASIAMYLQFPGDDNGLPFLKSQVKFSKTNSFTFKPHDPKYLAAAVEAYEWLIHSNMTNDQGLFVDGYHISGWNPTNLINTKCDERNEMVYTYNQGVILSGQLGLYRATGNISYLEHGHKLISNVINATGWDLDGKNELILQPENYTTHQLSKWYGLGRSGILEELCDASASCSQDSQTFKGIFFHHLTAFCSHLADPVTVQEDLTSDSLVEVRTWHDNSCKKYGPWIRHNAEAALSTLDAHGRFGAWWGVKGDTSSSFSSSSYKTPLPPRAIDYRNSGLPQDWLQSSKESELKQENIRRLQIINSDNSTNVSILEVNDRGRGRTVETQAGGLCVLRALWEIVEKPLLG